MKYGVSIEASTKILSVKFEISEIMFLNHLVTITTSQTVSTTRPEKCDIFTQRYQSQPITTKFQKHCLYFLNLQKPCQKISLSEYFARYFTCCIPYNSKY